VNPVPMPSHPPRAAGFHVGQRVAGPLRHQHERRRVARAPGMFAYPHFKARDALVGVETERFGKLKMQGAFPKFSATPSGVRSPAPSIVGQHNSEIYGRLLGISDDELAELHAAGAI